MTNPNNLEAMAAKRAAMVEEQLRSRGIRDERLLAAMSKVPRERFIFDEDQAKAYGDFPLPIGEGQTISQPYIVAAMIEALMVAAGHRVLEIGTGTGYQAAILGELACEVWTVERHADLAGKAGKLLSELDYENFHVVQGDGSLGLPEHAPFHRILVAAAAPNIPKALVEQLAEDGRLVLPVGSRLEQDLQVVRKTADGIAITKLEACRFVPLIGEQGWDV